MARFILLSIPNFEGNERAYVDDAIDQGWVSTGGAYITRLENQLAAFLGVEEVATCQSGTAGLHISLIEAGVGPGDLVIVPTLTFIATVNPVRYQFANPIFMDCDDSLCMDPDKLRKFCEGECYWTGEKLLHRSTGRQIKSILVVHVFGNLADMERIMNVAADYRLPVIEDATEALGSRYTEGRYSGRYAGTVEDFGVYSFNGNKIITTGGGGAVTARRSEQTKHIRYLSTQAKDDPHYYVHKEVGYNYRMTNVQAALGATQMELCPEFIRRKQKNYEIYKELLQDRGWGRLLEFRKGTDSNKWFYSLELSMDHERHNLRALVEDLQEKGIQTRPIWGLIHEQQPYLGEVAYQIERALYYHSCILNISCGTQLTEDDIQGEDPHRVFNVGALGLENIKNCSLISKQELEEDLNFGLGEKFAIVTFHPVTLENNTAEKQFEQLLEALNVFPELKIIFTKVNADSGGLGINCKIDEYVAEHAEQVMAVYSLGMIRYLTVLQYASVVVGNSSSGIIETPSFCTPTVNIGDRQRGRIQAKNIINCAPDCKEITQAVKKALSAEFIDFIKYTVNPYGDGIVTPKIFAQIKYFLYSGAIDLKKLFQTGRRKKICIT